MGTGLLQRTWSNVLVKVFTDAGHHRLRGRSFLCLAHRARRRADMIGRDPFALEYDHQVLTNAGGPFFIDIALWDIIGNVLAHPQGMYLEYPHDPPVAPFQSFSALVTEAIDDRHGGLRARDRQAGLGVELNEEIVERYGTSGWRALPSRGRPVEAAATPDRGARAPSREGNARSRSRLSATILAARFEEVRRIDVRHERVSEVPLRHSTTVNPRTVVADAVARPIGRRPRVGHASPSARNTKSEIEWSRRP